MEKKYEEDKIQNQIKGDIWNIEEDVTKYGEFVSSYFAWLTLEKQKRQSKRMENMTDK